MMNKENQLLMLNNIFNQKRNSVNEAERRKQQQIHQMNQACNQVSQRMQKIQEFSSNASGNDSRRVTRSANSSPVTMHHNKFL